MLRKPEISSGRVGLGLCAPLPFTYSNGDRLTRGDNMLYFVCQVIAFKESRVTTVMAVGEELWVGLGNGHVVIFDVIKNNTYEDEAYVVLNENEGA